MKKILTFALALMVALPGLPAYAATPAPAPRSVDELVNMLPASDLVAVIDVGRAFNDLLPRLAQINVGGLDKMAKDLSDFTARTGINPAQVRSAVLGFRMSGLQGSGVVIIDGLDADSKMIEAGMKSYKAEFKVSEYKGKQIYSLVSKVNAPAAGPLSVKTDEMSIVSLAPQVTALGDIAGLREAVDIQTNAARPAAVSMLSALKETREGALVRFALNIPEDLRKEASSQGDLFKSVSTIKYILGSIDLASDFSLSLDALMRTNAQSEAAELETGLNGLVGLVKGLFSGGDPKTDVFGRLLDQIKISSKLNDVSISISLPKSFIEQISSKPEPARKP